MIVLKLKKKQKDLKRKQVIVLKLQKKQKDLKQVENELMNEIACLKQKLRKRNEGCSSDAQTMDDCGRRACMSSAMSCSEIVPLLRARRLEVESHAPHSAGMNFDERLQAAS